MLFQVLMNHAMKTCGGVDSSTGVDGRGGWLGHSAGLDAVAKRIEPRTFSP